MIVSMSEILIKFNKFAAQNLHDAQIAGKVMGLAVNEQLV